MSVEIRYKCDTCRASHPRGEELFAVVFCDGASRFKLWGSSTHQFVDHKGVHVCKKCLEQYRKLNSE